jgi:hypothetical protein
LSSSSRSVLNWNFFKPTRAGRDQFTYHFENLAHKRWSHIFPGVKRDESGGSVRFFLVYSPLLGVDQDIHSSFHGIQSVVVVVVYFLPKRQQRMDKINQQFIDKQTKWQLIYKVVRHYSTFHICARSCAHD